MRTTTYNKHRDKFASLARNNNSVELSNIFLEFSGFCLPKNRFVCLIFEETEPSLWKYRPRSTFCPGQLSALIPEKKLKNRDLGISAIPNIDEVDRIYLASPRGLRWGKTEPPDYILMFCSANAPGITYKIVFGFFCPPFLWKKIYLRVPRSKFRIKSGNVGCRKRATTYPCSDKEHYF